MLVQHRAALVVAGLLILVDRGRHLETVSWFEVTKKTGRAVSILGGAPPKKLVTL
jgi:hypothetical protein